MFKSNNNEVISFMETGSMLTIEDMTVVRHKDCELVIREDGSRCKVCKSYRSNLFAIRTSIQKKNNADKSQPSIYTPDKYYFYLF